MPIGKSIKTRLQMPTIGVVRRTAQQTQINMNSLPTATYFVNVVNQENKKVQSFKIIKTQ